MRRRKGNDIEAMRSRLFPKLREIADECGYTASIRNGGHHWMFTSHDGESVIHAYPSTCRVYESGFNDSRKYYDKDEFADSIIGLMRDRASVLHDMHIPFSTTEMQLAHLSLRQLNCSQVAALLEVYRCPDCGCGIGVDVGHCNNDDEEEDEDDEEDDLPVVNASRNGKAKKGK